MMNAYAQEDGGQEQGENRKTEQPTAKNIKAKGAFRTISEVADALSVQQHVLRFWETKFSQVKPLTRGGGRRYYRPEDVAVLETVHRTLYKEGYTIKGAQKLFKGLSKGQIAQLSLRKAPSSEPLNPPSVSSQTPPPSSVQQNLTQRQKAILESLLDDLTHLRDSLKE